MCKFMCFLVAAACLAIPCTSFAAEVGPSYLSNFEKVIRMQGYTCPSANKGSHIGNNERGIEFIVACDDSLYLYYVLLRNNDQFCVEPYNDKGTKCR